MHEAQWHGVAQDLTKLRQKPGYSVSGEIKWRYFGPDNTDKDNSVKHLDQNARDAFRFDLYKIITSRKSLKIISCVANTRVAYQKGYVKTPEDLYRFTYKAVSERFQYHLQDVSRTVGNKQLGIIVADHRGKQQDEALRRHHHVLIDDESQFSSNYVNYIETLFLTPSHLSVGIQLADMVAGAIGRAFNSDESRFADALETSFRKSPRGKIEGYGLVKFPSKWD